MKENKEIAALLHLIDDPDEDVYSTVSERIVTFGKDIIPNLENLWETTSNQEIQERIELLIHRLHFRDLTDDFTEWAAKEDSLLEGALLVARYHYPTLDTSLVYQEIEKLRRNTWLELNNYLTPIEQVNIVTSIFYNYYKQKGVEFSYDTPDDYLINKTFETKKGNALSNGIIYIALCQLLDIPVKAINIPRQFILAYFDPTHDLLNPTGHASEKINFYIDPLNGQMYSHQDVEGYFKRISVPPVPSYFRQLNNKKVIQYLLEELSKCFDNDRNRYKMNELILLSNLLDE
ncbi:MAG: transglutaminase family protein [Ferruginibacter sp.]|nr:transglutaminase family protein [Bacteroidota bacterium]MBX2918482.1 transglutaminase family protein [Ferruginibacter sp.]MCB0708300.1 transglutaminase family protein [Chitinophagaceae bacterium]MCC7379761.1 transglutaminase family protein [Chitinophagaceae bacterium]